MTNFRDNLFPDTILNQLLQVNIENYAGETALTYATAKVKVFSFLINA